MLMSLVLLMGLLMSIAALPAAALVRPGDLNGDGKVTTTDARLLLYGLASNVVYTGDTLTAADYNGDGNVNTSDVKAMLVSITSGVIDYTSVYKTDAFGDRSIVVLGDSISHGASSLDIPNNSYVGLLKKAVNAKTGDNNYGFTSVEGTMWNSAGNSNELHAFPSTTWGFRDRSVSGTAWAEYRSSELLGTKGLGNSNDGAYLDFFPTQSFRYFCIYYQAGPSMGTFTVSTGSDNHVIADVNGNTSVNCYSETTGAVRTVFYDMSQLSSDRKIRLTVQGSGKEVIFTGIGYYDNPDGVVVTNYSNAGLQLAGNGTSWNGDVTGLDKQYLALAAQSETLIFALGYNDCHFDNNKELFTEKINYLIEECKKNGTNVIVNDLCWYIPSVTTVTMSKSTIDWYKSELKRLADETGGIYLDQQAIHGDALINTISDGAHPNATGHKMIADTLIEAMGL